MSCYFLYSQNKHSKILRFFQWMIYDFSVRQIFFKKESRSPRGFLPRPLLRAGESIAPPPLPQKNCGGAHQRFRFLDLCIRFGKMISKVCERSKFAAILNATNSFFEDKRVRSPSPAFGGAGLASARATPAVFAKLKRILMLSGEFNFFFLTINNTNL